MNFHGKTLSALVLLCSACPGSTAKGPDKAPQASALSEAVESIYDGGFRAGWQASGSAQQELVGAGGPIRVRFTGSTDWTLTRKGLSGRYDAFLFNVQEPAGEGEFLEVHVGGSEGGAPAAVKLKPDHRTKADDGWVLVRIPMSELNPSGASFDSVVLRSFRPLDGQSVLFDKIALQKASSGPTSTPSGTAKSTAPAAMTSQDAPGKLSCDVAATKISPFIYGTAGSDNKSWPELRAMARRWGGNPTSRYNWETHFSNSAQDWFFENHPGGSYAGFVSDGMAHGSLTALTIPTIGWAAKDGNSYSFPVAIFGPQTKTDPYHPDAGNGIALGGKNIAPGPPTRTSTAAPPEWAKRWVSTIVAEAQRSGKRGVYEYILDNEPMLWHVTHRDLHPDPLGYDELLDRSIQYGTAFRQADPDAMIAGPAEWGWSAYFDSAKDLSGGVSGIMHADRRAHGGVPLVEWYLRKLREHEEKEHVRILDVLDLHYYPQEANVYGGGAGGVDRATQLLRLRSTRSLWDPSYVDESWIHDTVRLLPRMKEWVAKSYPGRGISIGEWNFGGERDITGALAIAEVFGRFAQFGVTSAFYWTVPPEGSPSTFGFLAYRNFDKKGGRFLDWYVPSTSADGVSLFASRDADRKHFVLVAINMSPDNPRLAKLDLRTCGAVASRQTFVYTSGAAALVASDPVKGEGTAIEQVLPPWSIAVIDVQMSGASPAP